GAGNRGSRRVYRSKGGTGDYVDIGDLGGDLGGFGSGIDIEDLLGGMFGGRGRGGPFPGADQEAELEITVEEAYRGSRRQLILTGPDGQQRTIDVTIPAGVTDGQRIRVAGEGGRGGGGGAGDLYLIIQIAPHPRYRV